MNGWAPVARTYDVAGSVTSVTAQEPRFTRREKMLLLAARRERDRPRGSHGYPMDVALDPSTEGHVTVKPAIDFIQKALRDTTAAEEEKWPEEYRRALVWSAELRD